LSKHRLQHGIVFVVRPREHADAPHPVALRQRNGP
jgi:hypothetical protein